MTNLIPKICSHHITQPRCAVKHEVAMQCKNKGLWSVGWVVVTCDEDGEPGSILFSAMDRLTPDLPEMSDKIPIWSSIDSLKKVSP